MSALKWVVGMGPAFMLGAQQNPMGAMLLIILVLAVARTKG